APIGDGASAVIVSRDGPVSIRGSAVSMGSAPGSRSETTLARVARAAYEQAGIGPADVDVAEGHDATALRELPAYEELGFCAPGGGGALVAEDATSLGGRIPVTPSGGLESRGHPVAATGLAQVVELARQLRGEAAGRQVDGARVALAEAAGGFVAGD